MISKYISGDDGRHIGVVVADKVNDDTYNIEYSICSPYDRFDKKKGIEIAFERCHKCMDRKKRMCQKIHPKVVPHYLEMMDRASRYFKGCSPSERVKFVATMYG